MICMHLFDFGFRCSSYCCYFGLHVFSHTVIEPHLKEIPDGSCEAEEQVDDCFSKQMLSEQVWFATTVNGTLELQR